jgi:hypothetical protein
VGSVRGQGKAATAANAKASAKAATRARNSERPRKQTHSETSGKWKLIPSSEATLERLAAEPNTTVLLSEEEAEWRRSVEHAANEDPQAYLESCRTD